MKRLFTTPRGDCGRCSSSEIVCTAARFALESLEYRRLMSGYELASTIANPAPQTGDQFGGFVATQGSTAVISSPQKTVAGLERVGEAYLVDTISGATLHTFVNPDPDQSDTFGAYAQFIGTKLAISAPEGSFGPSSFGKVYVYDLTDLNAEPMLIQAAQPNVSIAQMFGRTLGTDGTDLFVSQPFTDTPEEAGRIYRYNINSGNLLGEYLNPNPTGTDALGSAMTVSVDTIYASALARDANVGPNAFGTVLAFDIDTGSVVHTYTDPQPDPNEPLRQYGGGLEVAANGDLFVGVSDFLAGGFVYQYDANRDLLRTYISPRLGQRGSEAFGAWIDTNELGQVIIGAQTALGFDDPENPTKAQMAGAVYIFDAATGAHTGTIDNPTPAFELLDDADFPDGFGAIFAPLPGGKLLIADPFDNEQTAGSAWDTGTVFVYSPEVVTPVNQAPIAGAINGPTSGVRQQTLSFSGSFSDADPVDTHQVSWDFGDGNVIAFHSTTDAGALTPSHVYTVSGPYNVTMTVKDAAGATSSSTLAVTVSASGLQGNDLWVGGTQVSETITITRSGGNIDVNIGGQTTTYTVLGQIYVLGGDGNDALAVGSAVQNDVLLNGGAGDDLVSGGGGNDIVIGDAGNDLVSGGSGRDLLIGGSGSDVLLGNAGDDIIVAGTTSYDSNAIALNAIMAEWTSGRTYAERVSNVRNGTGSATRDNGNYFISPDVTAFDDDATDTLSGGGGRDWYVVEGDAPNADIILDLNPNEIRDDADLLNL
ncbi:MAG: PKD domain-containing protein [Gemmatimonadaceae bacterium]|nr:PKD domain-containing protein [Gemmatimonadaceae bacterium]